jgi:hypothetical protein
MERRDPVHPTNRAAACIAGLAALAGTLAIACDGGSDSEGGAGATAGTAASSLDAGMDAAAPTPVLPLAGRPSPPPFVKPPMQDAGGMDPADAAMDAGPATSLGARCVSDADCTAPFTCLKVGDDSGNGEGPPRGLCTIECAVDATVCLQYDGVCLDVTYGAGGPNSRYCVENCKFGPSDLYEFSPDKCHGREEFACYPLTTGPTCIANCNGDVDCGTRICDPSTGLCGNAAIPGDPVGTKCDPAVTPDTCRGYCQSFAIADGGTTGACMEDCTWGRVATCGWSGTGPAEQACFLFPVSVLDAGGPGYGDVGNCVQLCDCNKDCLNPDLVCEPLNSTDLETYWSRKGVCVQKGTAGEITDCPSTM